MALFSSGLSGILASTLSRVCGQYLEDLDAKDLSLSIRNGVVELHDLRVKRDALDQLGLPLSIVQGTVKRLVVHIPWTSLRSKPLVIEVDSVDLVATERPIPPDFDAAAYAAYVQQRKETALAAFEVDYQARVAARQLLAKPDEPPPSGFLAKLADSIVANLQVTLRNVCLRLCIGGEVSSPFAMGIKLGSLSLQSTDANWRPAHIAAGSPVTYKLLRLEAFSVTLDPHTPPGDGAPSGAGLPTDEAYLLAPLSLEGRLELQSAEAHLRAPATPRAALEFRLPAVAVALSHQQLRALLALGPALSHFDAVAAFRAVRPRFR
eukprot:EG_transcript_20006